MLPPDALAEAEAAGLTPEQVIEMQQAASQMPPELMEIFAKLAASGVEINSLEDLEAALSSRPDLAARLEAVAQAMGMGVNRDVPSDLQPIIQELSQPARLTDMARRAQLCRQALNLLSRNDNPQLWAVLQERWATAWPRSIRRQGREHRASHRRLRASLAGEDPPSHARRVGEAMMNLANAYYSRIRGDRAENIEPAIDGYEQALQVMTRQAMPVEWAHHETWRPPTLTASGATRRRTSSAPSRATEQACR